MGLKPKTKRMTAIDIRTHILAALAAEGDGSSDFDLEVNPKLRTGYDLRPAAVLVPIIADNHRPRIILTKRSSRLKHHPGQIAFPGGKVDASDESVEAAALREAEEEIGLPPSSVELLGRLPDHETVTCFSVTPVVGLIHEPVSLVAEPGETEEIFTVPLSHVTNPDRFAVGSRIWRGMPRYYFTVPYGPYYIWGATARILRGLAERLTR